MDSRIPISRLTNPIEPPVRSFPPSPGKVPFLLPEPSREPRSKSGLLAWCSDQRLFVVLVVLLAAVTVAVYYPVHRFPFNSINDADYVIGNLPIQNLSWETVRWSFTSFHAANWHPLTWLSHALDWQFFGSSAGGHHASNLLLHMLNAGLLFWVLWRATGSVGRSFMVAALFALHPINVESVAWIAERKNLLSMTFLLLALAAYRWYARKPSIGRYNLVAVLFLFGLMAKPQVITLPFVFLLWDYWPLGRMFAASAPAGDAAIAPRRLSWLVLEKLPLLVFSLASAIVTVEAQRAGGALGGVVRGYPLLLRLDNAAAAYVRYLSHAVWPVNLAFFYPHPGGFQNAWPELVLLLAITFAAVVHTKWRYLAVGWLWFLGTLVPMIGLVQVGGQAMADRYGYLPFVGLFIVACWGLADWADSSFAGRRALVGGGLALLMLLGFATRRQLSYWSDDVALWSHTVEVTRNNSGAENVLGETLDRTGRSEEAMLHYRAAAATDPMLPFPHYHIGVYEEQRGNQRDAVEQFTQVLRVTQGDTGVMAELRADTLLRMARAFETLGDYNARERYFAMALQEQRRQRKFDRNVTP